MKKKILLTTLFIGPLVFFLFLATGDYLHKRSPIFTKNITEINKYSKEQFKDKISILQFIGKPNNKINTQLFNYKEVVFTHIAKYKNFQTITLYNIADSTEVFNTIRLLNKQNSEQFHKWKFIGLTPEQILTIYNSLHYKEKLNIEQGSNKSFIVDKFGHLRGRDDDDDKKNRIIIGYNMNSVNVLKNKLLDDTKNVFYQFNPGAKSREERLKE